MGKSTIKIRKVDLSQAPLEFHWYTVKTLFKNERHAADNITNNMIAHGFGDYIDGIITPLFEETKTRTGRNGKVTERKVMTPIYGMDTNIWIRMILTSDTWSIVRNSSGVAGWLNSDGRPLALTDQEVHDIKRIVGLLEKEHQEAAELFNSEVGDLVKINDGPMSNFEGNIIEINKANKTLKIMLPNGITVETAFHQVDKT